MSITKPTSILLGLSLVTLTVTVTAPAARAVSVRSATELQPAAATVSYVVSGPACPDVMVIGARGTNEDPTANANDPTVYAKANNLGVGQTVYNVYTQLKAANQSLVFSLEPVVYQTNAPSLLNFEHDIKRYVGDAAVGGQNIAQKIQATDAACGPGVHYILVGYSLGAWAVHDALLNPLTPLDEISGVALFGDPKFTPGQPTIVREDQSGDTAFGVATGQPGDNNIPTNLVSRTGSWCLSADPVCQAIGVQPSIWESESALCVLGAPPLLCAHYQYAGNGNPSDAAAFLSPFLLPSLYLTGSAPPTGTVGNSYTWTATATPAETDVWTSTGTLPPGLSFGAGGTLSGTPTQAGTYTFSITATDVYGRHVTGPVTVTVNNPSGGGAWSIGPAQPIRGLKIAAVSPTDMWAINSGAIVHGNGTSWDTPITLPGGVFEGIDAINSNDIWAVGYSSVNSVLQTVAVHSMDGGQTWTSIPGQNVGTRNNQFTAVAGVLDNQIWAAGYYIDSHGTSQPLIEFWNGSTWSVSSTPVTPNVNVLGTQLTAIAVTPTDAWAVGLSGETFGSQLTPVAMELVGGSWQVVPSPVVDQTHAWEFTGVAIAAPGDIWAVGTSFNTNGAPLPDLIEHYTTASGWQIVTTPQPAGSQGAALLDMSMGASNDIWAAGAWGDSSGVNHNLVKHFDGSHWTVEVTPDSGSFSNILNGIAATGPGTAAAVGWSTDSYGGAVVPEFLQAN